MRHGKSDYPGGTRDYDRPLADRGETEAAAAGRWIRNNQPRIDAVICSAALRTRETFAATGIVAPARFSDQLYDASPADVLADLALTGSTVHTLLVIGHAPGIPSLAFRLADEDSDQVAMDELTTKFPTSALAVLRTDSTWSELAEAGATLVAFEVCRPEH